MPTLFDPVEFGPHTLRNRIFMAPMTRGRSTPEGVPTDIMVEYYRQRSSAGLIFTEATAVSAQGVGWLGAPGIFTAAQEEGWRPITKAVHDEGGKILLQILHAGRYAYHPLSVSASSIKAPINPFRPRKLSSRGVAQTIDDFVNGKVK